MLSKVYWGSFSSPCVNVFKPFYFAGQVVPERYGLGTNIYSEDSPWWMAEKMKRLCDVNYKKVAHLASDVFSETEKWELARSREVESAAIGLIKANKSEEAAQLLEDFSKQCLTRTEKEYKFLHQTLQDRVEEVGMDYLWPDFLRENCEINELSLPGL